MMTRKILRRSENEAKTDLSAVLRSANPRAVLTFAAPEILSAPLFVNFKRAAVVSLNAPQNFNRQLFETAITREFLNNVTIKNSGAEFKWETVSENNSARRELKLPMLGFIINYVLRGNILILTNDGGFLSDILTAEKKEISDSEFAELTVINLAERENAFENVFSEIGKNTSADDFFTGNIASLFDSAKDIKKIEFRKNYSGKILEEELIFYK